MFFPAARRKDLVFSPPCHLTELGGSSCSMNKNKKRILVLSGVHSAGKSTIGKAMSNDDNFAYYDEIGRRLRCRVTCTVLASCFLFDREIMTLELERDRTLKQDARIPVVESWHIGNVAFALEPV